jgi:hypothetical protein
MTEEDEDGTFTDDILELIETVLLCATSTCATDGATLVGKTSTCFEESGSLFDDIFEGILVDGIFLGCICVHFGVDRALLVNAAACFGLNACMAGVCNRCILVFSPVCACSLVLDVSGAHV